MSASTVSVTRKRSVSCAVSVGQTQTGEKLSGKRGPKTGSRSSFSDSVHANAAAVAAISASASTATSVDRRTPRLYGRAEPALSLYEPR
jgi:hypothetical protein